MVQDQQDRKPDWTLSQKQIPLPMLAIETQTNVRLKCCHHTERDTTLPVLHLYLNSHVSIFTYVLAQQPNGQLRSQYDYKKKPETIIKWNMDFFYAWCDNTAVDLDILPASRVRLAVVELTLSETCFK
jgi:hypothetical protein